MYINVGFMVYCAFLLFCFGFCVWFKMKLETRTSLVLVLVSCGVCGCGCLLLFSASVLFCLNANEKAKGHRAACCLVFKYAREVAMAGSGNVPCGRHLTVQSTRESHVLLEIRPITSGAEGR